MGKSRYASAYSSYLNGDDAMAISFIERAKNGEEIYLRPIAGLKAMEDAVGRATEMGKPVLYVPGISGLDQIDTLAGLTFLLTKVGFNFWAF